MIQRRQHLGFALEAGHALGVGGEVGEQDFERDVAVQARVASAIDFAHAARAEQRDDLVRADFCARWKAHFFTAASQFTTTVRGISVVSPTTVFTRKRLPSAATAYVNWLNPGDTLGTRASIR